ncbi:MAG: DNA repair protein RecN [Actinomycetota bacterium]|nr:DNA repair protein RecN [Actinomycetota bacterium]
MLRELIVENLGVIERAELELDPGGSALTGETGAGKTLLVSALGLLLGGRADRSLIRHGAAAARVEARFHLVAGHPALAALEDQGLVEPGDIEVVISRTIAEAGGKVRINGRLAAASLLAEVGPLLAEIAGQHEQHRLGSKRYQLELLDAYIGGDALGLAREVAEAVRQASAARRTVDELETGARERERELDVLHYEMQEIEAASPGAGESDELRSEAARLEHAEAIAAAVAVARAALEDEGGALDRLREAGVALSRVTDRDPSLEPLVARLDPVVVELDDVARDLAHCLPSLDPDALEVVRQRLATLTRLQRKYGVDDADVLAYLERCRARAASLEGASSDIDRCVAEAEKHEARARSLAEELSRLRAAAAPRLQKEIEDILGSLAMAGTQIQIALQPAELYEGGLETVELRAGSAGHPPRPIAKVASGGELSRIALALRLATGRGTPSAPTVVFDEVDAGIGGEAARAVGRALADLARGSGIQVLVVTHLPQVAAFLNSHHRVQRVLSGGAASATVEPLTGKARVEELSRMLAGLPESDTAREHAQELLEVAGRA